MVLDDVRLTADQRRGAILAAARHEFASRGFRGARTAAIASGAGCSEPTLYKHFPSKQALFAAVLRDATDSMKGMVDALMATAGGPMAGMLAVAERATSDPLIVETIRLRTLAAGLVDDPEVRAALTASVDEVRGCMAAYIAAGQAAGEIRRDVDPDDAAWILYGYTLAGGHAFAVQGNAALGEFVAVADTLCRMFRPLPASPEETP
jgi:TetR/AcrR family transcriptional regulator, mexJK operon transcriptional repressor